MANKFRWKVAQGAERKWWQHYLRNKEVAPYLAWKEKYWTNLLQQCAPEIYVKTTLNILDAGCGPAGIFMVFPDANMVACDPLIDTYEQDLAHFKKNYYKNVQFVNSGLEEFKSDIKFDIIFCMNAINHVQNIALAYDNLIKYLKPGGKIIVSIDAHNNNFFKKIFQALPGDILHPHQYNLQEYEAFLSTRNIKIEQSILIKKEFWFSHYVQVGVKV
jgi:2-polyprenyl-3-methyl-5-hydroxy-6-metoxy-1,4-benzoquinol methylase